jgi:hypothetical protein
MAGRNPQAMRQRDESAHQIVLGALDAGLLDSGREDDVPGMAGHAAANNARLAVNRAAGHLGVSVACWVTDSDGNPCYKGCQDASAVHGIRYRIHSKAKARDHIVSNSGGDPANLRFNPFAKAAGPVVDDYGRRL